LVSRGSHRSERLKSILKGQETGKLNHLANLSQIIDTLLNLLQVMSHGITLVGDLEKLETHRALEKNQDGDCESA